MKGTLAILALATLSLSAFAAGDALTRTSDERSVKVQVTPLNLSRAAETLDFRVVLETHSVDLSDDLAKVTVLRNDRGSTWRPASWKGPRGGHHVEGLLRFAGAREILKPTPAYLELQMEGVAGVPLRTFRWDARAPQP